MLLTIIIPQLLDSHTCLVVHHCFPLFEYFKLFILLRSFLLLHFILHSNVFWNKLRIHFIDGVLNQYECKGIGVQQHPIWLGSWLSPCSPYHILRLCGLEKALGSLHDWGHGHVLCVFFRVNYFFLMICYYMYL